MHTQGWAWLQALTQGADRPTMASGFDARHLGLPSQGTNRFNALSPPSGAPTGLDPKAQGNALGRRDPCLSTLKGLDKILASVVSGKVVQPFQGWGWRRSPTQGVALGFWIQPRWGSGTQAGGARALFLYLCLSAQRIGEACHPTLADASEDRQAQPGARSLPYRFLEPIKGRTYALRH